MCGVCAGMLQRCGGKRHQAPTPLGAVVTHFQPPFSRTNLVETVTAVPVTAAVPIGQRSPTRHADCVSANTKWKPTNAHRGGQLFFCRRGTQQTGAESLNS